MTGNHLVIAVAAISFLGVTTGRAEERPFSVSFALGEEAAIASGTVGRANQRAIERMAPAILGRLPFDGVELVLIAGGTDDDRIVYTRSKWLGREIARRLGKPALAHGRLWRHFVLTSELGDTNRVPRDETGRQSLTLMFRAKRAKPMGAGAATGPIRCPFTFRFEDRDQPPLLEALALPPRIALGPTARVLVVPLSSVVGQARAVWRDRHSDTFANGRAVLERSGGGVPRLPATLLLITAAAGHRLLAIADALDATPKPEPRLRRLFESAGVGPSSGARNLGDIVMPLAAQPQITVPPVKVTICPVLVDALGAASSR